MPRLDIDTRRTQLIDAAIRIALRDGLDNTTVRRIATEAGVSLGTVHYCFDNKRALLEAVYELVAYLVRQEAPGPELAQRIFANKYEVVRGFLELFQKKGEAELGLPADVIARMTVAMTDGVALAWLADGDDEKALEVLDSFAEILARTQT